MSFTAKKEWGMCEKHGKPTMDEDYCGLHEFKEKQLEWSSKK